MERMFVIDNEKQDHARENGTGALPEQEDGEEFDCFCHPFGNGRHASSCTRTASPHKLFYNEKR